MKKKRLITSALPYVNNIPHLGNLIQVLSADVFARFCRAKGYETLYVCGTDEYGTATETRALEEGITPKELCHRYYTVHTDIYNWFNISFDRFGRTSTPAHTKITQAIFKGLEKNGYIKEAVIKQLYCDDCGRFLADRYVRGICPACKYEEARGDQCEHCGKLLDPTDLIDPKCGTCGKTPVIRETSHLYIDLPRIKPILEEWLNQASVKGFWAYNAVQMTKSWIRDGLKERCITRDLKWGIPVPKKGYEDKVFYVWFDAPIGYVSITANHTDQWETWWKNPDQVELFQFIGKDNIPFHTVIFPCSLLGSGEKWTLLHHMSSTEYLNYEAGKFSKSKGIGVFGTDAKDTGIPADVWRFYMYYNRPEKADALFTWKDFQEKVNGELIGNLSNLVNRTLTFVHRFYAGKVPTQAAQGAAQDTQAAQGAARMSAQAAQEPARQNGDNSAGFDLQSEVKKRAAEITAHLERAELRDGLRKIFSLSSVANKAFQEGEPWKSRVSEPEKAALLLHQLVYVVRDLAIMCAPYIPDTTQRIAEFIGNPAMEWDNIGDWQGIETVSKPEILFSQLEDKQIEQLRERFAGTQKERLERDQKIENANKTEKEKAAANTEQPENQIAPEEKFAATVDLRVGKITAVERHPQADKLYLEQVDVGTEKRQIVSGLVGHYTEEELLNRNIILVYNLKPAKLRGEKSDGMLLAAEKNDTVEVLFADWARPGDKVVLRGMEQVDRNNKKISVDTFFSLPMKVTDHEVLIGKTNLVVAEKEVVTEHVADGTVG